ncbi:MAG TPA: tripartite tricarboxylate transporter substrate-binding protein [Burkholderiales bacterium]|jgi:tripartite-type tricarboxylate transporter receptor subunit TctC|nr:tripartite tricarboxylate transporter substrate-binding protein [Burkholderiales bacterium]
MRLFALALALICGVANAQYPTKPVRVVIGYAAGSSTDIVGRVMTDRLAAYWKQSVYVETRAGAAGNLAADAVAKASGDGYTLLFAQNGLAISAAALPNLPYNAERDLVALAPVAATPHILIVANEFPAKNVQELIARGKAEPGKLSFASSGVGNSDHLCGELFNLMAGITAIHVPYKGGAPAAVDIMGNRIGYYFAGMPVGLPLAKSGKARALGVTSAERFAGAPDIPTIAEQGLPGYSATLWQGFFAPSSVPPELAGRIAADIEKVMSLHETHEKLAGASVTVWAGNQADFKRAFSADIAKWRDVVKKANLKLD